MVPNHSLLDQSRLTEGVYGTKLGCGPSGCFVLRVPRHTTNAPLVNVVSTGSVIPEMLEPMCMFEHAAVSVKAAKRLPTFEEAYYVADILWGELSRQVFVTRPDDLKYDDRTLHLWWHADENSSLLPPEDLYECDPRLYWEIQGVCVPLN